MLESNNKPNEKNKSTAELTVEYIKDHPHIRNCLKKGLINYSSLARHIAKELEIEKKSSKEAILIAASRFSDNLKKETMNEKDIKDLLENSELEIKNKINVFIFDKHLDFNEINQLQKTILNESGTFYLLGGSDNYTLITQDKYKIQIKEKFKNNLIKNRENLALINLKTSDDVENILGVTSYLTSLFAENNINIIEILSCYRDNLFIINEKDLSKTLDFLKF
jgi:hypothetical protein